MNDYSELPQRLADVKGRIEVACARAGRAVDDVRLIAVSKRHPAEAIVAAHAAGQRDFGENYVQEMVAKLNGIAELGGLDGLRMRFIGRLQRNKASEVVAHGCAVDTVDSERLARTLSAKAEARGAKIDILLQVNVGREPQKAGVMPEGVSRLAELISELPAVKLCGLMAIPPAAGSGEPGANREATRGHFERVRVLAAGLSLPELSMGMSGDLELAVEQGATMVRIGTAIFGPRPS